MLWHSFFFLRSFLHFFPHFVTEFGGFFLHFVILILHFLWSLKPLQSTSGSAGGGGSGDGGAEGGRGSHEPQVFLHFCSFAAL